MSDFISRGKLLGTIEPMVGIWYDKNFWIDYKRVLEIIEDMPSAEIPERTAKVTQVERKSATLFVWKCENCGQYMHKTSWSSPVNYCSRCGARLDWSGNE